VQSDYGKYYPKDNKLSGKGYIWSREQFLNAQNILIRQLKFGTHSMTIDESQ